MALLPESLNKLIEEFQKLPTIGRKSAERLAMSIVDKDIKSVEEFSKSLVDVKKRIHHCKICGNLTEDDECIICRDFTRDEEYLCIVEDVRNLIAIEKSHAFRGRYHVLGGLISPSDDIGPDKLNIDKLIERLDKQDIKEIILAISSTIEGETTTLFISNLLKGRDIKISKIAQGIPVGSSLEYFDQLTLERALEDRRDVGE